MRPLSLFGSLFLLTSLSTFVAGCSGATGEADEGSEDAVVVDNRSPLAKKQYQANVEFAKNYRPTCKKVAGRKSVLVSGFGRFMSITDNATGRIVSKLTGVEYPATQPPASGEIDPPAPQLRVKQTTLSLPKSGDVEVCGLVLPVFWDLAAIIIAKEASALEADFVLMNGVAGGRQPLYLELGSVNRAMKAADGSDILLPYSPPGKEPDLITGGPATMGLLLSFDQVQAAAAATIEEHKNVTDGSLKLGDILTGAIFGGFPRGGNTYLCNNVTYVTNVLMSKPNRSITLLRAADRTGPEDDYVKTAVTYDTKKTPREFMHWPSELVGHDNLLTAAADVMKTVIDTQIKELDGGTAPSLGSNDKADPSLRGGQFF